MMDDQEVKKLIKEYCDDVEPMTFEPLDARTYHYGIRHPSAGWFADCSDRIFCTMSRKVAWAQVEHLWSRPGYSKLWYVVCIEDWVDEQQAGG